MGSLPPRGNHSFTAISSSVSDSGWPQGHRKYTTITIADAEAIGYDKLIEILVTLLTEALGYARLRLCIH